MRVRRCELTLNRGLLAGGASGPTGQCVWEDAAPSVGSVIRVSPRGEAHNRGRYLSVGEAHLHGYSGDALAPRDCPFGDLKSNKTHLLVEAMRAVIRGVSFKMERGDAALPQ